MARQNKDGKTVRFRLSLVNDNTHQHIRTIRFTRAGLTVAIVTLCVLVFSAIFSLIAFTPIRTFIPGYPDAHTKRAAIQNAIKIDSLENTIILWELYSENLRRVIKGDEPFKIDSLLSVRGSDRIAPAAAADLALKDSLLRKNVAEEEQFGLSGRQERKLPIEGMHFFTPLKGVVSQGYDKIMHPYIDITAPANSVVKAVLDGSVIFAGWNDEAGYTIQIQHDNDIVSIYKHNQKLLKKTGDKVSAGAPISVVGSTGSLSTGDHLHFELWYKGEAVDPTGYINF